MRGLILNQVVREAEEKQEEDETNLQIAFEFIKCLYSKFWWLVGPSQRTSQGKYQQEEVALR